MTTTTFFVDVYAWGASAKVLAAFRQMRRQIKEHNEDLVSSAYIQAYPMRQPAVAVRQIPGTKRTDVVRAVPVTVDAKTLTEVPDALWSAAFIQQGGTMAFVALNIADPTPVFGWINRDGVVLKQGWDIKNRFARDKHGNIKLDGPHGADALGDTLFDQFLRLPAVREHLVPAELAKAS